MAITVKTLGNFEGKSVEEAVLTGENGAQVHIMNWGVAVRDWTVPAPEGQRRVVLGFDDFAPYPAHSPHFGSLAGRVANRIAGASFELDGEIFQLEANEGPNSLHGGPKGLGRQVWDMQIDSAANAVRFSLESPDGQMGFPGIVAFTATYRLTGDRLWLELTGVPDRPTPISLVQHQYFNLGLTENVLDHEVHMPSAVARTLTNDVLLTTGDISPVAGTPFDFRSPRNLRAADGSPIDFDLNLVLATGRDLDDPIARATGEDGALTLQLWSDRPGLQFYNSVWTKVDVPGLGGRAYGKYSGLCFEDQMFPDALHQPHFPSIICTPDRPYHRWCEIEIAGTK